MLLHLCPRFFGPANSVLVDLHVEPFGLLLRHGADLATRRPYPNKDYQTGCRRKGSKAIKGLLIETRQRVDEFTTRARWAVGAEYLLEHTVKHRLLEHEFDFTSECLEMWYGFYNTSFDERRTEVAKEYFPILAQPLMEIYPDRERPHTTDVVTADGIIISRHQEIEMPTLERGRLELRERYPSISDTFVIP